MSCQYGESKLHWLHSINYKVFTLFSERSVVVFPLIFVTIHQWRHLVLEFALEGFACFAGQEFRQDAGIKAPVCSVTHEKKYIHHL